jgi:hypothetical protein
MSGMPLGDSEMAAGEADGSAGGTTAKCRARGPRKLRTIRGYHDLQDLFRARILEFGSDFESVDEFCGFTTNYVSKLLAPRPMRNFGTMSLDAMLSALGVTLVAYEDPRATARARERLKKREYSPAVSRPSNRLVVLRFSRAHYRRMARARMLKLTPEQRSEIARNASRKRWHKPVIKEIEPAGG